MDLWARSSGGSDLIPLYGRTGEVTDEPPHRVQRFAAGLAEQEFLTLYPTNLGSRANQPQMNPREKPGHRERGPIRYHYTFLDVAKVMRRELSSLRSNLGWRSAIQGGLRTLSALVVGTWMRDLKPVADADPRVTQLLGAEAVGQWKNRWPRFELYPCASCEDALLLVRGLCRECGGPGVQDVDWAKGYIALRVGGRMVPYHRLVVGCLSHMDVHHKDGNKWNNRPDNLEILAHDVHWEKHKFSSESPLDPGGFTCYTCSKWNDSETSCGCPNPSSGPKSAPTEVKTGEPYLCPYCLGIIDQDCECGSGVG